MPEIIPTIGRVVWYYLDEDTSLWPAMSTPDCPVGASPTPRNMAIPMAAIISYVHPRYPEEHPPDTHVPTYVALSVFDHDGHQFAVPECELEPPQIAIVQGDRRRDQQYCEWMPYQKGQAAKTEALEEQLSTANDPVDDPPPIAPPPRRDGYRPVA